MQRGNKVRVAPVGDSRVMSDLRALIAKNDPGVADVAAREQNGVCTIVFQEGVVITGFSRPSSRANRQFILIHECHLEIVE